MNDVWVIAQSTALRVLRSWPFYFLLGCGVILMCSAYLYGDLTMGMEKSYAVDLGFALVGVAGVLAAMIAPFELPRELKEKTLMTVLSKPLARDRYVLGKFLGIAMVAGAAMVLSGIALLLVTQAGSGEAEGWQIIQVLALQLAGAVQLTAIGVLLGVLFTDWIAAAGTVLLLWLGHAVGNWAFTAQADHLPSAGLLRVVYVIVPNFSALDMQGPILHGAAVDGSYLFSVMALCVLYTAALLTLAGLVFRAKDIS